jgi:hypothetical protein
MFYGDNLKYYEKHEWDIKSVLFSKKDIIALMNSYWNYFLYSMEFDSNFQNNPDDPLNNERILSMLYNAERLLQQYNMIVLTELILLKKQD